MSSCILHPPTSNEKPAPTLPYKPDLVLYLTSKPSLRYHQTYCLYLLFREYLVLYLTPFCPPPPLIIRIPLPPFLRVRIPTPKISRILL